MFNRRLTLQGDFFSNGMGILEKQNAPTKNGWRVEQN
jgi:hypothetical protein